MTEDEASASFVSQAASELAAQGFPRMPAYVIMALTAAEDGRMSAAELAETLGVSAAAVSGAVRYLTILGFIRTLTVPGTRRHVYALSDVPWYTVSLTRPGLYRHIEQVLRSGVEPMAVGSAARARIEEMADFFRFVDEQMPLMLEQWRAQRPQP